MSLSPPPMPSLKPFLLRSISNPSSSGPTAIKKYVTFLRLLCIPLFIHLRTKLVLLATMSHIKLLRRR